MDPRLGRGALLGVPLLALAVWLLSSALGPAGALLALGLYWGALLWGIAAGGGLRRLEPLLLARWPGWPVALAMALPILVPGLPAMRALGGGVGTGLVLLAALAGLVHAALEEAFWRGALVRHETPRAFAQALALYGAAHLPWLLLRGVETALPLPLLVLGALAMGGAWTAARLLTGGIGAGLLGHAGLAVFLFVGLAAGAG